MSAAAAMAGNLNPETEEQIRRRAYERYLQRGAGSDSELDDWLEVEKEFREHTVM